MKDRFGEILYVGKAKDLKKRVSTYFQPSRRFSFDQPKIAAMVELVRDLDTIEVRSEAEALLLEGKLIKEYKPRYNTDFTDDKRFLLIRVDIHNPIPRFHLVRTKKDNQSRYFGPFAYAKLLRTALAEMQRKFGILQGSARPTLICDTKFRLYQDARAEIYGHPNEMTLDEYRIRVEKACEFLQGKSREWLGELETEMQEAAQNLEFEKAARHPFSLYFFLASTPKTQLCAAGYEGEYPAQGYSFGLPLLPAAAISTMSPKATDNASLTTSESGPPRDMLIMSAPFSIA